MEAYIPHLIELKNRLLKVLAFFFSAVLLSYYFRQPLYQLMMQPLLGAGNLLVPQVIYTDLTEAFTSYLRLAVFAGIWVSLPVAMYQIYRFLAPGLYTHERKILGLILSASPILFWLGGIFMFIVVIPKAWEFFLSFQHLDGSLPLVLQVKLGEYVTLMMHMTLAFGLAFQVPIILLVLTLIGIITPEQLKKGRRFAIIFNFILAAILTPPDVISQIALALPLVLLYELAIMSCKLLNKKT